MKKTKDVSLIASIVFFILGLIVFLYPDLLVKTISYGIGGLLVLIGIFKCFNYYVQDKRFGVVNRNELSFGISAIILGILFVFLVGAIELLLRVAVGGWLIISGIMKIRNSFYTSDRSSKYYALIIVGAALIMLGLYIIFALNLVSIIGLFMMLYGLIEFISYFVYKNTFVNSSYNYEEDNLLIEKENKKQIIIETEFEEKK